MVDFWVKTENCETFAEPRGKFGYDRVVDTQELLDCQMHHRGV